VNSIFDPATLLARVHDHLQSPCLFIENKSLYSARVNRLAADGRIWQEDGATFPTLKLSAPNRAGVTVVVYGGMVGEVENAARQAFIENEIVCELLVPTKIYPLDLRPIIESVSVTGRLLVVEEGQGFAGFGAEVIAACLQKMPAASLVAERVFAAPHPIPCGRELEKQALPNAGQVLQALLNMMKS